MEDQNKIKKESEETKEEQQLKELKNKIQEMEKRLEESEKMREEYLEGWQRQRAEFLNYQKDVNKKIEEIIKMANEELIKDLLNVLDSFDISINSLKIEGLTSTEKNIIRGIELIREQLLNVLKQRGLQEIKSVGEDFNPALHEAIDIIEGENDGKIAEEIIKGYQLNNKVIRPTKVKIIKKGQK